MYKFLTLVLSHVGINNEFTLILDKRNLTLCYIIGLALYTNNTSWCFQKQVICKKFISWNSMWNILFQWYPEYVHVQHAIPTNIFTVTSVIFVWYRVRWEHKARAHIFLCLTIKILPYAILMGWPTFDICIQPVDVCIQPVPFRHGTFKTRLFINNLFHVLNCRMNINIFTMQARKRGLMFFLLILLRQRLQMQQNCQIPM